MLPIVAPHGRPPLFDAAARTRARSGRSRCGRRSCPRGGARRGGRRARRRAARRARARAARLGGRHRRRASTLGRGAGATPRACAARSARGRGWAAFLRRAAARCSPSASRRPARRRRSTSSRRRSSTRRSTGSRARRPSRRPPTDVLHVTAAGWSAIPAVVHKALHGTPMVLTEHGVYVREAYLAAARSGDSPGSALRRHAPGPRAGARRPTRAPTSSAPVTDANAYWEMGLGIDPAKILVLYNGLRQPASRRRRRGTRTVVSVGRIDPLKDIHTMLRVAAETLRLVPDARFLHYGPVTERRGGLRPLVPGAARAARARRPLPLHGPHDATRRRGARRRRGADDEHLRGAADVDPRGDGRRGGRSSRRASAACPTSSRAAASVAPPGRRPRARDGAS